MTRSELDGDGLDGARILEHLRCASAGRRLHEMARDLFAVDFSDPRQVAAYRATVDRLVVSGLVRLTMAPSGAIVASISA